MKSLSSSLFRLRISRHHKRVAQRCADSYATAAKRQQVYNNVLAIAAVQDYLAMFNIVADRDQSPGWQPQDQALDDNANLHIPGLGQVACRPVLTDAESCYLPPGEHDGCIAVQFDAALDYATMVGFVGVTASEMREIMIPLTAFQDFEALFAQLPAPQPVAAPQSPLEPLEQLLAAFPQVMAAEQVHQLGGWLQGAIASSWQEVATLSSQLTRQSAVVRSVNSVERRVERCKVLAIDLAHPLTLIVAVEPKSMGVRVTVELWPIQAPRLPEALELQLLDPGGVSVMQAHARSSSHLLFTFSCDLGDAFDLKIALNDTQLIESFVM